MEQENVNYYAVWALGLRAYLLCQDYLEEVRMDHTEIHKQIHDLRTWACPEGSTKNVWHQKYTHSSHHTLNALIRSHDVVRILFLS